MPCTVCLYALLVSPPGRSLQQLQVLRRHRKCRLPQRAGKTLSLMVPRPFVRCQAFHHQQCPVRLGRTFAWYDNEYVDQFMEKKVRPTTGYLCPGFRGVHAA